SLSNNQGRTIESVWNINAISYWQWSAGEVVEGVNSEYKKQQEEIDATTIERRLHGSDVLKLTVTWCRCLPPSTELTTEQKRHSLGTTQLHASNSTLPRQIAATQNGNNATLSRRN
ncbi:hypothetical protein Tcan_00626, partial [Toxocara canis]